MSPILVGALCGVLASIAVYLFIAEQAHKRVRELRQFFLHGWELRDKMVAATIFSTSMSLATVVIALLQLGLIFGIALSWATITFCLGWFLFIFVAPTIRRRTLPRDTIHSFIGRSFGSATVKVVASAATIIGFLGLFATELFAADIVFKAFGFTPAASLSGIILLGIITIVYPALGGFRAVVRSDWSQTAFLLIALAVLVALAFGYWHDYGQPPVTIVPQTHSLLLPFAVALSLFFVNVPFPFVDTQAWQRVIASQSDSDFKRGTVYAVTAFGVTWTILIGTALVLIPVLPKGADPFITLLQHGGNLPTGFAFIVGFILFPGLLAAMFSSAEGFLNSAGHCFSLDLTSMGNAPEDADVSVTASWHVIFLGVAGLTITLFLRQIGFGIIDMVFAVSAGQLALFPSVIAGLYIRNPEVLRRLGPASLLSITAGFLAAWLNGFYSTLAPSSNWSVWKDVAKLLPADVYRSPIYALIASAAVFLIVAGFSVLTPRRPPQVGL
jgi:Na+/proline symporter